MAIDFLANHLDPLDSPTFINDSAGLEMAQLICGGCRTLLMYTRGATSVRCSCCHTVNLAPGTIFPLLRIMFEVSFYILISHTVL